MTRPRRFVTFYISALEILLLTYLLYGLVTDDVDGTMTCQIICSASLPYLWGGYLQLNRNRTVRPQHGTNARPQQTSRSVSQVKSSSRTSYKLYCQNRLKNCLCKSLFGFWFAFLTYRTANQPGHC